MKRCLVCGMPSEQVLCFSHTRVFLAPWDSAYVSPAWVSAAVVARRAELARSEHFYRP